MTLDEMMGRYWPGWSIVRQLGKGSYGAVYEVVRTDFTMEVKSAIKVITIPDSDSEVESLIADGMTLEETRSYYSDIVKDFISEIQLMETFRGTQNIVSIEDYQVVEDQDRIGWTVMIRMELLTTLNSFVAGADVTEADILKLGIDMCSALEMCARKNVIHRDIKPENIFVNPFGDYKLGDFGVARQLENVTGALSQKGTYNYMAPEIDRGDKYDSTVDIYSLGLVLYRFMNRRMLPFLTQENSMSPNARVEAVKRRLNGEPLPPPCMASRSFAQIILKACAYHPAERYQSAKEMKQDLNAVLNECDKEKRSVNEEPSVQVKTESETMDRTVSVRHAQAAEQTHQGTEPGISEQPLVRQTPISSSVPQERNDARRRNKPVIFILSVIGIMVVIWFSVRFVIYMKTAPKETLIQEEEVDSQNSIDDFDIDPAKAAEESTVADYGETDNQATEYKSGDQSGFADSLTPGLDMAAYFNTRDLPDESDMELLRVYLEEIHEGNNNKPSLFEDAETVVYPEGITLGWGVCILNDPELTWSGNPEPYEGYGRCLINMENNEAEVTVDRGELAGPYSGRTIEVGGSLEQLQSDYPGMGERYTFLGGSDGPDIQLTLYLSYFIIKDGRQYAIGWASWGDGTEEAWLLSRSGDS